MDLGTFLRLAFGRWYITLLFVGATVGACVYVWESADPDYEARAEIILLAPSSTVDGVDLNPYVTFERSLDVTTRAVAAVVNDSATRTFLADDGVSSEYVVEADEVAPILHVTATARSGSTAVETVGRLVEVIQRSLIDLQLSVDAPADQLVTAQVISQPAAGVPVTVDRDRLTALIGAAGLALLVAVLALVERRWPRATVAARRGTPISSTSTEQPVTNGSSPSAALGPVHAADDDGVIPEPSSAESPRSNA